MKISKKEDFALLFTGLLAKEWSRDFVPISRISEETGMPPLFLKHIARELKKSGVIISKEGLNGGYKLAKNPRSISVYEVIKSINEVIIPPCSSYKPCKALSKTCKCKKMWTDVGRKIENYLKSISLHKFSLINP